MDSPPYPVPPRNARIVPTVHTLMENLASQDQDRHVWLKIDDTDEGTTHFRRLYRTYVDHGRLILEGEFE